MPAAGFGAPFGTALVEAGSMDPNVHNNYGYVLARSGNANAAIKSFLNATDDAFSINVQATTGGGALAAPIPPQGGGNPKAKLLFADDTNVYEYM